MTALMPLSDLANVEYEPCHWRDLPGEYLYRCPVAGVYKDGDDRVWCWWVGEDRCDATDISDDLDEFGRAPVAVWP